MPLITIPFLEAKPIAAKYANGTEITMAHGQPVTRISKPETTQVYQSLVINPPISKTNADNKTMIGVYHLANVAMNSSAFDFFSPLLEMSSIILATALSSYFFFTFKVTKPLLTKQPAKTSLSFISAKTGTNSPVKDDLSI